MTPADHIALKAYEFFKECRTHDISWGEMKEILSAVYDEHTDSLHNYPDASAEEFVVAMRRQQIINKVSTTCERLRQGTPLNFDLNQAEGN